VLGKIVEDVEEVEKEEPFQLFQPNKTLLVAWPSTQTVAECRSREDILAPFVS
jgi:hypothetical protein